jgi:hypothetical protein
VDADKSKSTTAKITTSMKNSNELVKKKTLEMVDKAKNISKKEVPKELKPEDMQFVDS